MQLVADLQRETKPQELKPTRKGADSGTKEARAILIDIRAEVDKIPNPRGPRPENGSE
jgi:hypothetical protein